MAAAALVLPPTTPPDYHRIVSPTLRIPADTSVTIPVGLLTCQRPCPPSSCDAVSELKLLCHPLQAIRSCARSTQQSCPRPT
ncbi:hypothetical protein FA95DRAFT_1552158 [Auriscalpium vulgare]|uniref:Uncharacterized protein n=1 Tax=Auriscalpium vulgare TaxID=40419 RepID=A0ACB8SBX1_9AGAM|nr:hypothetical protein FA95DRAFT_1552158 [Auriscalpium vulgare]